MYLGMRLPTEVEWEFAARNKLINKTFPTGDPSYICLTFLKIWITCLFIKTGDEYVPNQYNIWQGKFPDDNTIEDGCAL
jgi:hypothetical protein